MEQTKDFYTSAIFWKDLKDQALLVKKIQEQLNNNLKLEQYGTGLKTIVFVPMAQLPEHQNHPEEIQFFARKKMLSLYLQLDYQGVANADEPHFLHLLSQRFLAGLDAAKVQEIRNFDGKRFREDVGKVLEAA